MTAAACNLQHISRMLRNDLYFSSNGNEIGDEISKQAIKTRQLIQNYVKFQWSVFIFLNTSFHAFVLRKFPLSLFNTLSCHTWLPPRQFPTIPSLSNTYFSWREFWSVTSRNDRGSLFSCSRGWPDTFDAFLLMRCTLISLKTAPTSVAEISRFQW